MSFKSKILYIAMSTIIILAACSGASTEEKIYDHLEEAVKLESGFEEQQDQITELEKQEQELYSQVADLSISEIDEIKELSQQAIDVIEERSSKITLEKESIDASKEEFEKIKSLIEKIKEQEAKDKAEEMYDVMLSRYEAYNTLHEAYKQSLEEETELYTLLQKEDITEEDIADQITKINKNYEEVLDGNEGFNTDTVKYNELKKEFYSVIDIEVKYEED